MPVSDKPARLRLLLAALFIASPAAARADASLTYGSGPNDYRSYAFKASVDILKLPLQLDLDHFQSSSTGVGDMKESGAGLTWNATDLLGAHYRHSRTDDEMFEVAGNEGGLSFALDTLWDGDLRTSFDAGYGAFDYEPTAIARARLASKLSLSQKRRSVGFSQDFTPTFSVYATHDQYEYDRNLKNLAIAVALFRRTLNTANMAFTLLSFPDKTNTLGMSWQVQEKLTLDLSSGKTTTILEQQQKNTRLGVDYQLTGKLNFAAAVTRSSSTALVGPFGNTIQAETRDTYTEFTAGWAF